MSFAVGTAGTLGAVTELPDFRIPHAEKIEWMIETKGYAIEPVAAREDVDPPVPGYCYTIGVPELVGFPEIVVFGLTPVAASGLLGQVVDFCVGGTDFPIDVEFTGLFDNELRAALVTVDVDAWSGLFSTGVAWRRGDAFDLVQLIWPDRNGFLPTEPGFDARIRPAQPVLGRLAG
jgi:hypothetical protein